MACWYASLIRSSPENAATNMKRVDLGKWKLVIILSAILKRYPGVINIFVSPTKGSITPLSLAAVSNNRRDVDPTGITFPPELRALLMISLVF